MKLLLDERLPRKLKNHLPGHECLCPLLSFAAQ